MERVIVLLKQYRYGIVVLILGLALMILPSQREEEVSVLTDSQVETDDLQKNLEKILSQIDGAGKVSVLLTKSSGEITLYQQDSDISGESSREDTVVISGTDREETGLIRQVIPATYQGAIIVCQGGDRPAVKLAIVDAVSRVTGLTSDKIIVLKMK